MIIGKEIDVIIDRPLGSKHPKFDMIYPLNYGYVENLIVGDKEKQDVYVVGVSEAITYFHGEVIAVVERFSDIESKWVVAPKGMKLSVEQIEELLLFQEQYFHHRIHKQHHMLWRSANPKDMEEVLTLKEKCIRALVPNVDKQIIMDGISSLPFQEAYVLYDHGQLILSACIKDHVITNIFVHPFFQKEGYENYAIKQLEDHLNKYAKISLHVPLSFVDLYKDLGYTFLEEESLNIHTNITLTYAKMQKDVVDRRSLDGRIFIAKENSSNGEVDATTRFYYHEEDDIIWAEYYGGEIKKGYLIGHRNEDDTLYFTYQHINQKKELKIGECHSKPMQMPNGTIALHETWQWLNSDRSKGTSILVEFLPKEE